MVRQVSTTETTVDDDTSEITSTITYDPPLLRLPAEMQVGLTLSKSTEQRSVGTNEGQPFDATTTFDYTISVLGRAPVSSPAGDFPDAWRVQAVNPTYTSVDHFVDDVGYVPVDSFELISYY